MPKSRKSEVGKEPTGGEVLAWIRKSAAIPDRREAVMRYVKMRTIDAYKNRDYDRLPQIGEIAEALCIARSSISPTLVELVEDGALGRLRPGRFYHYYVTEDWFSN